MDDSGRGSPAFLNSTGDIAGAGCPRHYIMRSSWVIGEGRNFVKTMKGLSDRVDDLDDKLDKIIVMYDQLGRLTFTRDMATAVFHVLGRTPLRDLRLHRLRRGQVLGRLARAVFEVANGNGEKVVPVGTADYYASVVGPIAPRPAHFALDLSKLETSGFHMPDWDSSLSLYLKSL